MVIRLGPTEYRLCFSYQRLPIGMGPRAGCLFTKSVTCTICASEEVEERAFHGTFIVPPGPGLPPKIRSKESWRKIAMIRALRNAEFTKAERRAFWSAYLWRAERAPAAPKPTPKRDALRAAIIAALTSPPESVIVANGAD